MTKIITLLLVLLLLLNCKSDPRQTDVYGKKPENQNTSFLRGKNLYQDLCITCHLANGEGVEKVFPPLANSDYLKDNQTESIRALKFGMTGKITVNGVLYNSVMAPLGLSDKEVADVMNYINNAWGNSFGNDITSEIVSEIKK